MSKHHRREEWLNDIDARQRNVVFPDTAANEARFWRNLYEGKQKLTVMQAAGIALMAVMALALFIALSVGWGHEGPSWQQRVASAAIDWAFVVVVLGGFLLLLKWATRRETPRR